MKELIILNIQEAKTHLSRHVDAVAAGAEFIIAKAGKPMARLVPYQVARAPRVLGRFAGEVPKEGADCWAADADLEAEMVDSPLYARAVRLQSADRVAEEPGL